jgi:HD superfamily phosphohydrolase
MERQSAEGLRVDLKVGDLLGKPPYHYVVQSKDPLTPVGQLARPLGTGGSSVVYRALFKGQMARAIKLLAPREDLRRGIAAEQFVANFEKEKNLLSEVTHTRISKIHDFGEFELAGQDHLFYAMDLIEGDELAKVLPGGGMRAQDFLVVVDQILDGIAYLHDQTPPVMHCDVKAGNILVRETADGWEGTLVDLGVAKPIKEDEDGEEGGLGAPAQPDVLRNLGDETTLNTSRKLIRPEWEDWLYRPIPYAQLRKMFPSHDLYSVGVLLDEALGDDAVRERFALELGPDILAGIVAVRDRLKRPVDAEYYDSVERLRSDWRKLMPGYLAPLDVPELAVGGSGMTSLALPGGRMTLTPRARDALSHPLVQRLRHIPQLEFVSLIHPGATHTRLQHVLATFDMAKQMVGSLLGDPMFRLMAEPVEVEATLLWALLHDIGHYPLSHMFEDFVVEESRRVGFDRRVPTDDDLFFAFVDPERAAPPFRDFPGAIESAFAASGATPSERLRDHLLTAGFAPAVLDALHGIEAKDTPSRAVLAALLSSPIDVDKLAYLSDDSRATGVGYGAGQDRDALLASLRAPAEADFEPGQALLGITDKGLPAAEQVVLARYWMMRRVYWHRTNRAIIAMIKFAAWELLEAELLTMPDYVGRHLFGTADVALRYLHDVFDEAIGAGAVCGGEPTRNPLPGLLGGSRDLYKEVLDVPFGPDDDNRRLHNELFMRRADDIDALVVSCEEALRDAGVENVRRGDVIIDVPLKGRESLGTPIRVYGDFVSADGTSLDVASPLLSKLSDEFLLHVKKSRVFVHPGIDLQLAERRPAIRQLLREVLSSGCGLTDAA